MSLSFLTIFNSNVFAQDEAFKKQMDAYLSKDENVKNVGDALQKYFMKLKQQQEKDLAKAEQDKLEDQFKNPVKVDIGTSPVKGNKDAKVTIVEFSDFQCPFCARGAATIEQVLKLYPNDVKLVFKHYPLPFHQAAKPAAKAANAAAKQGKFWEMHDLLFKNQQDLTEEAFNKYAQQLGLNIDKFKADYKEAGQDALIDAETKAGQEAGVNGTPAFFVNGVLISGAQPVDAFKSVIDRWLKK